MLTIAAVTRSAIVLLVLAADEEISNQDLKIASYAQRKTKDILIVYNKWDLVEKDTGSTGKFIKNLHFQMPFVQYAPIIFISAKTHQRIHRLMECVVQIEEESKKRIPTSELNRFMETVISRRPPTHPSGKHVKIFYITQASVQPPIFIFFCNTPALITENYRKFLNNQLRELFKFSGVSIKLIFKGRDKEEIKRDGA